MGRTEEVEVVLRRALDIVIRHGVVLIDGEYGVVWGVTENAWIWDRGTFPQVPHCCVVGAFVITEQPLVDPALHKGDVLTTFLEALKLDKMWGRDLMNGFDKSYYQGGGYPDAFALGARLRERYRPICFEFLALGEGASVSVSETYKSYLRDFVVPEHDPKFVPPPPPAPLEPFDDEPLTDEVAPSSEDSESADDENDEDDEDNEVEEQEDDPIESEDEGEAEEDEDEEDEEDAWVEE